MFNLLQQQEALKGLSDDQLAQYMVQPSNEVPQYLVMSELQRRKEMRDEYTSQGPGATVAEEMTQGIMQGVPQGVPQQPTQPQGYAHGGQVRGPGPSSVYQGMNLGPYIPRYPGDEDDFMRQYWMDYFSPDDPGVGPHGFFADEIPSRAQNPLMRWRYDPRVDSKYRSPQAPPSSLGYPSHFSGGVPAIEYWGAGEGPMEGPYTDRTRANAPDMGVSGGVGGQSPLQGLGSPQGPPDSLGGYFREKEIPEIDYWSPDVGADPRIEGVLDLDAGATGRRPMYGGASDLMYSDDLSNMRRPPRDPMGERWDRPRPDMVPKGLGSGFPQWDIEEGETPLDTFSRYGGEVGDYLTSWLPTVKPVQDAGELGYDIHAWATTPWGEDPADPDSKEWNWDFWGDEFWAGDGDGPETVERGVSSEGTPGTPPDADFDVPLDEDAPVLSIRDIPVSGSPYSPIIYSLWKSESRGTGDWFSVNEDGYTGLLQFGDARLQDYINAMEMDITPSELKKIMLDPNQGPGVQKGIFDWHFRDIDNYIEEQGLSKYAGTEINGMPVTQDAMRAIAHLGGKGGLRSYLTTGGAYDEKDNNGTPISEYHRRHFNATNKYGRGAVPEDMDADVEGTPGVPGFVMPPFPEYGPSPYEDKLNALQARLEEMRAQDEAGAEEDKWLALAKMGLGIAGGESPYFATNVGQGAIAGLDDLAELNAARRKRGMEDIGTDLSLLEAREAFREGDFTRGIKEIQASLYGAQAQAALAQAAATTRNTDLREKELEKDKLLLGLKRIELALDSIPDDGFGGISDEYKEIRESILKKLGIEPPTSTPEGYKVVGVK